MSDIAERLARLSRSQLELLAIKLYEQPKAGSIEREPIAIVGMACRFPESPDATAYWDLLRQGRDATSEVPADRWDAEAHYDETRGIVGKMYTKRGAFLPRADEFDAGFFRMGAGEADGLDPQQRLFFEVACEALDDAGMSISSLRDRLVGTYLGIMNADYLALCQKGVGDNSHYGLGTEFSFASGRLSHFLGARGPCMTLNTACSSSLTAIHLACHALRAREADTAIAGGTNRVLIPEGTSYLCQIGAMAADGRCKTFDASGDGYGRGEGCGVVILRRLSDALRDGDRIWGIVQGSAVNHTGYSAGPTAPNGDAEELVMRAALNAAGLDAAAVDYVEAHGTGTPLGDPIELDAIARVYGAKRSSDRPVIVGSVKTNFGHLEAAAGMAGLSKVLLAMKHEEIPPHIGLRHLNSHFPWSSVSMAIPSHPIAWKKNGKKFGAISSFGMSGTNAHVIVEEAPAEAVESLGEGEGPYLLPLSGRSEGAAKGMVERWSKHLSSSNDGLLDQLYTASARRSHYESRIAVVAKSRQELVEKLSSYAATGSAARVMSGQRKGEVAGVTFVYSGQGSQWARMGTELMSQEPEFAQALKAFDDAWQKLAAFSIISELSKPKEASRLSDTEIAQPCIVGIQVALTALWKSWGIAPENVIGHSIGEVTAGYVAGVYSLEDTIKVLFHRSRLMQKATGQGKMTSIEAPRGTVEAELSQLPPEQASKVSIGADNSPQSTVISGEASAVDALSKRLQAQGITTRELGVNYAFHSAQMADIAKELEKELSGLTPKSAQLGLYSTVTGSSSTGSDWTAAYWRKNVGQAVEFRKATGAAIQEGAGAFIEVGPHPVLSVPLRQTVEALSKTTPVTHSLRRDNEEKLELLTQLGALYTGGYDVDWKKLYPKRGRVVSLPSYAWQKKRYWIDAGKKKKSTAGAGHEVHPLLGQRLQLSTSQDEVFEAQWSLEALPYLEGHKVFGTVVCPGAAYAEMGLSAGRQALGLGVELQLEGLEIQQPLTLDSKAAREVQLVVTPNEDGASGKFQIASRPALEGKVSKGKAAWAIHASGRLGKRSDAGVAPLLLASAKEQHKASVDVSDFYEKFLGLGLGYTGSFAGVRELYRGTAGSKSALGRVELNASSDGDAAESGGDYGLHPGVLDGCFQVMAAAFGEGSGGETPIYLPVGIEALLLEMLGAEAVWCHARVEGEVGSEMLKAHLTLWGEGEQFLGEVKGLTVRKTSRAALEKMFRKGLDDWFYEVAWQEAEKEETALAESASRWVIFADKSGVGRELGKKLAGAVIVHQGEVGSALLQETESSWRVDGESKAQVEELFVKLGGGGGKTEVVYLWGLDAPGNGELTAERLAQWQHQGSASALHVTQALAAKAAQASAGASWRLSLVTAGAQAAQAGESAAVAQAPLWGFGRVVSQEHPELGCLKLDLEANADVAQQAESLVAELKLQSKEDQVALRGGKRLVARLIRSKQGTSASSSAGAEETPVVRADASYLITGGLGGLGLQVAVWMVKQGAKHLVLAGRSAPSDVAQAAIARMMEAGAQVTALRADVSKAEDVQRLVDVCQGKVPLKGVIHAAGVLDDGLLGQQTAERFDKVMGPKALGAWNLHEATKHLELDQFVMFSSMASVFGNAGQSNYAAANAFLDALAWARAAQGLPAQSQNWGAWAEAGMAAAQSQAQAERWKAMGMDLIGLEQGLEAYGQLLQRSAVQLTIAPVDWAKMGKGLSQKNLMLAALAVTAGDSQGSNEFLVKLKAAPEHRRKAMILQHVREQVRAVLGLASSAQLDDDKGLFDLGMDSLAAVNLRGRFQASLEVPLLPSMLLDNPQVGLLATALFNAFNGDAQKPTASMPVEMDRVLSPDISYAGARGNDLTRSPRTILVTGSTGFIGAFLTRELLEQTDAEIICLVRDTADCSPVERVYRTFEKYGIPVEPRAERLRAVAGDLEKPFLGLDPVSYDALAETVDGVFHVGASVKFTVGYELVRKANVLGTTEVLRFAARGRQKKLHFVSSFSVFEPWYGREVCAEIDWVDEGTFAMGYAQSKWVAEGLARQAIGRGLPGTVYRPGFALGHSRTGIFNTGDYVPHLIKGCLQLGAHPDSDAWLDMTPVDYVSRAIVELSRRPPIGETFHILNPKPIRFNEVFEFAKQKGYAVRRQDYSTWRQTVMSSARPENALYAFLPLIEADEYGIGMPRFDCSGAIRALEGKGVICPPADKQLLETYFQRFVDSGFLKPPGTMG